MSGPVGVLLDLLFPPKCVFCGRLLASGERDFCARCQRELPWLEGPGRGSCRCFVSDRQEDFSRLASTFLGWDVAQAVEQVDISQY